MNKPPAPCPRCARPNGGIWSEDRFSGYWRRHNCGLHGPGEGCGLRYVSVLRESGTIDIYDGLAPRGLWAPYSDRLATYPAE